MKKKSGFRLLPLDILIILLAAGCGIFLTVRSARAQRGARICVNANGVQYEYSASADGAYTVQGELGPTTFEIKDGRVRITDSPCPNKTCVAQGWHSPLVCLPNKVIITVEGEGGKDTAKGVEFDAISE